MGPVGEWLFFFLVFPGAVFAVGLGLAMSWADRKVSALVQWRRGPSASQPFWDVVKLLGKEIIVPEQSWAAGFLAFPFVAFAAAALAATLTWHAALRLPGGTVGDLIVVLYLLAIPSLAVILGAVAAFAASHAASDPRRSRSCSPRGRSSTRRSSSPSPRSARRSGRCASCSTSRRRFRATSSPWR